MRPGLFSLLFTSYPDRGGPDGADAVSPALLQSCLSVCRLRSAGYYGDVEPGNGRAIRLDSPGMNGKLESVRAGDTSNSLHRWTSMTVAWMLAIFFAVWAMRGATATDITLNDQARHALNGVALLDIVREGGLSRPVAWLRDYFVHFPALSMPYHPPLFPAVEALFYA